MKNRMHRNTQLLWTAALLAIVLLAPLPARPAGQIATASYGPSDIQWRPQVPNNGFILRVAGHWGEVNIRRTFKGGESPRFQPNDLPDGIYKWELRVIAPEVTGTDDGTNGRDPKLVKRLTRSRSGAFASLRRRMRPPTSISGSFTIQFGGIVDPNRREPGAVQ